MRAILIGVLVVLLIAMILIVLWPAIMATIGAILGFWSLKKLLEAKSLGEKIVYGVLIGVGALIILANLKGILVVAIIGAIIYFLTRNKNKPKKNDDIFDYPYNK
ncbi:lmo0954 family membrane protein [Listeria seeligeri]|uniref:Flagellar basal body rod protein n=2 Tax=Listeria seeligeri TaxID=1640 RepID=A0A7X0X0N1_LISSE|nr:hypothetical protein [Listeria seeligeri]EFS03742.1 conserved hypothetical protein [Listeria seeligeri FSL S4-171]EFS00720.1 conserved hypothetical protein [Listeria seeligeri FSL N1-067]KKD45562.1 hypothetical protein UQ68_09865 [Listeria seeligeri]MBC1485339.1 hypothetical protein [Listeria seeligeri]MBC1576845.1 hypothetical protein [Listeria seeligeri]